MQFPPLQPVTRFLLLLNIGLFAVFYFLEKNTGIDASHWLGLKYVGAETFFPTQFFTYMFLHGSLRHLIGNMIGLFFFGNFIEMIWGGKRFLTLYLVTGIGAGVFYSIFRYVDLHPLLVAFENFAANPSYEFLLSVERKFPPEFAFSVPEVENATPGYYNSYIPVLEQYLYQLRNLPCIGASGSIFGLIAGLALLLPEREIQLFPIPIPIKLKYFAVIYFLVELKMGISRIPGDNVAHYAHIGGAVVAFIYIKYWEKLRKTFS